MDTVAYEVTFVARSCNPVIPGLRVNARALSSGISPTGTLTVFPCIPVRELDRLGRVGEVFVPDSSPCLRWKESDASLLHAEKTSLAASPENPNDDSHSLKTGSHLLQAETVQLPILLSSLAILDGMNERHGNMFTEAKFCQSAVTIA